MIHPSYFELMNVVNKDVKPGEDPVITSRYSIVLGTAKRARQLVAANRTTYRGVVEKPLSIAVDELKNGEIHILREEPKGFEEEEGDSAQEEWDSDEEIQDPDAEQAGEMEEDNEEFSASGEPDEA